MVSNLEQLEEKIQKLKYVVTENTKKFGIGKVKFGIEKKIRKSTGSIYFDYLINGGFEEGTIALYYGKSGSGKSTMALRNIAEAQRRGEVCAWLRVEKGVNREYMEKIGVDVDKLIIVENLPNGEAYLDVLSDLVKNGVDMIVVDSLSALAPKVEMEESLEKQQMGVQARLISKMLRKVNFENVNSNIIFISQVRQDINAMGYVKYNFAGGKAAEHTADYIVQFTLKDKVDDNQNEIKDLKKENKTEVTGAMMLMYVEKCRRGIAHRAGEMYFSFKTGKIDEEGEIITVSVKLGFIQDNGGWIKLNPDFVKDYGTDKVKESCRAKDLRNLMRENENVKQYYIDLINDYIQNEA